MLIARVTTVYTKKFFSSPRETNENMFILWKRFLAAQQRNFNLISIKFKSYKRRYAGEKERSFQHFPRTRPSKNREGGGYEVVWTSDRKHSGTEKTSRGGTKISVLKIWYSTKKTSFPLKVLWQVVWLNFHVHQRIMCHITPRTFHSFTDHVDTPVFLSLHRGSPVKWRRKTCGENDPVNDRKLAKVITESGHGNKEILRVPHRRRHTRRHYWAPPSCSWKESESVRNEESLARSHARRCCTHLFSLWPLLWKHPRFREWQMQAARQKKKSTTPKVLRKIPRMSTSSATEGGIYFPWSSLSTRLSGIRVLLYRDLKFSEANQQSLQAWWLILEQTGRSYSCRLCGLGETQDSVSLREVTDSPHRKHWLRRSDTHRLPSSGGDTARAPRRSWPGSSTPRRPLFSPVGISGEIFSEVLQRGDTSQSQQNAERLLGWR